MFLKTMDDIYEYVIKNDMDYILKESLCNFYNIFENKEDFLLEDLINKFNLEEFNETGKKIEYFIENIKDIKDNILKYKDVYFLLSDEKSKKTYIYMLNAKIFINNTYIDEVYDENEMYFDSELYNISSINTYVDCGGYIGDSVVKFSFKNNKFRKIYMFEPIKNIMEKAYENIKKFIPKEKFNLINKATYDKIGIIGIKESTRGDSYIDKEVDDIFIDTTTIDEEISEKIDLIKLDVEGSEKESIIGCEKHIKNDHPIIVICVYHLKDDFWKIPNLILSIRKDYNIFLRQYDPEVYSETVMYFVPNKEKIKDNGNSENEHLFNMFKFYTKEENDNIIKHIKDKKWFIRQIRNRKEENYNLKLWTKELEDTKSYKEEQIEIKDKRIKELEDWTKELENAKSYQEEQIEIKDKRIKELENWIKELEAGKDWVEKQSLEIAEINNSLVDRNILLEENLSLNKTEISKLNYKLNLLKNDKLIKQIIKFKKYEI